MSLMLIMVTKMTITAKVHEGLTEYRMTDSGVLVFEAFITGNIDLNDVISLHDLVRNQGYGNGEIPGNTGRN